MNTEMQTGSLKCLCFERAEDGVTIRRVCKLWCECECHYPERQINWPRKKRIPMRAKRK
jgi:hypothetical protein